MQVSGMNIKLRSFKPTDIELVKSSGSDYDIASAARVSYIGVDESNRNKIKDSKLIHYLYTNKHMSPFEHVNFTFRVEAPVFVARQWMRHRICSFNEKSARYAKVEPSFWLPGHLRAEGTGPDKQKSGAMFSTTLGLDHLERSYKEAYKAYTRLMAMGVTKEQARACLPFAMYTEFYWTINLRSLFNFIELRSSEHAQPEIKDYADQIVELIQPIVPTAMMVFRNETLQTN